MSPFHIQDWTHVVGIVVVCVVFWVIAVIAVGLRVWARRIKKRKLCFNDYMIFVALFLSACFNAAVMTSALTGGAGQHFRNADRKGIIIAPKTLLVAEPLWSSSNTAVKFSILHLYVEIFRKKENFRRFCYFMMALTMCFNTMVVLETLLLCRPLAYNWNPTIPGGHCADRPKAWLSSGIINLLLDICIIYMPLPLLWKLQMPTTKKLGITAMFGVGAVILVFTIFRIVSIRRLDPKDLTYGFVWVIYWGVLEPLLGIVNACAPTVRPAIEKMLEYKFPDWSKLGPGSRKTKIYMSNSSAAHSAGPNDKAFNRLYEHEYPSDKAFNRLYECELGDIDVEGQVAVPETTYSPDPSARNSPTSPSENAIKVTRGWNVG